jgi:hypothetical protein
MMDALQNMKKIRQLCISVTWIFSKSTGTKEKTMIMKNRYFMPAILFVLASIMILCLGIRSGAASSAPAQGMTATPPGAVPSAPTPGNSHTETDILTGSSADINGKFKVPLSVPGGTKDSIFTLSCDGSSIIGTITNPYNPGESCSIYNGKAEGNRFNFSTRVGGAEYNFEGTAGRGNLSMTLTTLETILLDAGLKIKTSKETPIDGAYLVPVYSPGGIMENIFFLKTEGNALTGQMVMISNPMKDKSDFFDGSVSGNEISIYTRTPQSLFHFKGTIEGDKIKLNLIVKDVVKGVKGSKM